MDAEVHSAIEGAMEELKSAHHAESQESERMVNVFLGQALRHIREVLDRRVRYFRSDREGFDNVIRELDRSAAEGGEPT